MLQNYCILIINAHPGPFVLTLPGRTEQTDSWLVSVDSSLLLPTLMSSRVWVRACRHLSPNSFQIPVLHWASSFPPLRLSFPHCERGVLGCNRSCLSMASTHRVGWLLFGTQGVLSSIEPAVKYLWRIIPISHFSWKLRSVGQTGVARGCRSDGLGSPGPHSPHLSPRPDPTLRALWPSAAFRALKTPQTCRVSAEQVLPLLFQLPLLFRFCNQLCF